jgi:hypothetical protein
VLVNDAVSLTLDGIAMRLPMVSGSGTDFLLKRPEASLGYLLLFVVSSVAECGGVVSKLTDVQKLPKKPSL